MTLLDDRPSVSRPPAASGAAGWRGSWRVSLRMARRDVRRHKGRSAIVALMAGLPIAVLCFAFTMASTVTISGAERIPYELGTAAASVMAPQEVAALQTPDVNGQGTTDTPAQRIPGYSSSGDLASQGAALDALLHGKAIYSAHAQGRVMLADGNPPIVLEQLDPRALRTPLATLVSGHWPRNDQEVVVSRDSVVAGLPTSGPITLLIDSTRRQATVVGIVDTKTQTDVFTPIAIGNSYLPTWLIERDTPVTWSEVRQLNRYGLLVLSADVLRNPPPEDQIPVEMRELSGNTDIGAYALGALFLALIVILLTAPAFAVSASRQRRTLALAAANGAEQRQLRRAVLAQGVVLGGLSVVLGGLAGIGAAYVVSQRLPVPRSWQGPWDVPWLAVLGICLLGMAACVVAALLPALRLGRLDVVGVMKGQSVSPPLRRRVALVGLFVTAASTAFLLLAPMTRQKFVTTSPTREACAAAVIALCLGGLMIVPWLLVTLAKHSRRLPIALRMAARDTARHRSRSIPTVAATLAATAAIVAMMISFASYNAFDSRNYRPTTLQGEAVAWGSPDNVGRLDNTEVLAAIHRSQPSYLVTPLQTVTDPINQAIDPTADEPPTDGWATTILTPGCTFTAALEAPTMDPATGEPAKSACLHLSNMGNGMQSGIGVLPLDEISRRFDLTASQRRQVAAGALVLLGSNVPAQVSVGSTNYHFTDEVQQFGKPTLTTGIPTVAIPPHQHAYGAFTSSLGAVATPETAARLGWGDHLTSTALLVRNPSGAIPADAEKAINDQLTNSSFTVEQGFQSQIGNLVMILLGCLLALLLVTTLTSTALAMAEQRADDATMAAVGATRRTRRSMAAAHAYWLALLAAFFGSLAGLAIGQALAKLTVGSRAGSDASFAPDATVFITIPWLPIAAIVLIAPLVAAALAWLAIRKAPKVTRRAT
ncbi:putative ABC transport system permease protein [Branchiibius hedensis]|uniref:Putative ABC transport system permease protein n=1 Tax=Branchiibius hedensis TaxID=672460 RepID=A0A2Y8ZZC3_9MICO|nr:FtsX-like permease family protein [Branchiibius hedensis]PWJ26445.1 putative ABC transport system permease protein [Branchiibius hedensis]SSA35257.1 putative ABC transport system permease protein [Branchiibius hedensis]